MERFEYLQYALAVILVYVGAKLTLHGFVEIPSYVSLSVIIGCMTVGIAWSWVRSGNHAGEAS
ncbi:MAG: hypothetical protein H5U40_13025 [Polyangiaceae bacterium]|nr:hypothetical protein [Polyangiaceae bacterium]